jgi:hypothetical protein
MTTMTTTTTTTTTRAPLYDGDDSHDDERVYARGPRVYPVPLGIPEDQEEDENVDDADQAPLHDDDDDDDDDEDDEDDGRSSQRGPDSQQ